MGQKFVKAARAVYHPRGFHKGYNFLLFIITCGALVGFALARFQYPNIDGIFLRKVIPGEQYWYAKGRVSYYRTGIILHIVTALPAAFLVCFGFVLVIRYEAILFHRLNGYLTIILLLLGNAGAFMIIRHAVGGEVATQTLIGVLDTLTTTGFILAYINIKRLQVDQHRAWMLRTWAWAASIISPRLILMAANHVVTRWYTYTVAMRCSEIFYRYKWYGKMPDAYSPTPLIHPACKTANSTAYAVVSTTPRPGSRVGPETSAAMIRLTFGVAGWIALVIHAILVELYLGLTPAESARLRQVSYERRLKAGYRHPENGALTATRLDDAPEGWNPGAVVAETVERSVPSDESSDDELTRQKVASGTHIV